MYFELFDADDSQGSLETLHADDWFSVQADIAFDMNDKGVVDIIVKETLCILLSVGTNKNKSGFFYGLCACFVGDGLCDTRKTLYEKGIRESLGEHVCL